MSFSDMWRTKESLESLTPERVLEILKEGNKRFVNNLKVSRNLLQQVNETKNGQFPFAFVLSCIDSRTSAELIFDQGLGDIFSCRIAGNVINSDILGSMEFACKIVGSKLIVVLGHTQCGAISGACQHMRLGHLTGLLHKIEPSVREVELKNGAINGDCEDLIEEVGKIHVKNTIEEIKESSHIIAELLNSGKIGIVGGKYDVKTGMVTFFD